MIIFLTILIIISISLEMYLFFSLEKRIALLDDKILKLSRTQSGWITLTLEGESRTLKYCSILDKDWTENERKKNGTDY